MKRLALLVVACTLPALADESQLYVSIGGGGAVLLPSAYGGSGVGLDVEVRGGYRFSPVAELCLSVNYVNTALDYRVHLVEAVVDLQYHFVHSPRFDAYVRGGLGSGLGAFEGGGVSNPGFAADVGLGLDFALGASFHLGPQIFYRHLVVAGTTSYPNSTLDFATGGLQLNVSYF